MTIFELIDVFKIYKNLTWWKKKKSTNLIELKKKKNLLSFVCIYSVIISTYTLADWMLHARCIRTSSTRRVRRATINMQTQRIRVCVICNDEFGGMRSCSPIATYGRAMKILQSIMNGDGWKERIDYLLFYFRGTLAYDGYSKAFVNIFARNNKYT